MNILECKKIYKSYTDKEAILKNVSFEVANKEIVTIQGVSGSGKTTLLNIMSLIDTPDSGELFFDNKEILKFNEKQKANIRNKDISIIFQKYNLFPQFNVLENVIMPVIYQNTKSLDKLRKEGREILGHLGMESFSNAQINELSGGQQQRVAIARSLMIRPKLLLADEPTANVDKETEKIIMSIFTEYKKNGTVIIVSHNPLYQLISDRTLILQEGSLIEK